MKFLLLSMISIFFLNCSNKNAFSSFHLTKTEALIATHTQENKIIFNDEIVGLWKVIYLNNVEIKKSQEKERFLIALYLKKDLSVKFYLNNNPVFSMIDAENKKIYIKNRNLWQKYYEIIFNKERENLHLSLKIQNQEVSKIIFPHY